MTEKEIKLIIGSLLHDVGKVIYRQGEDRRKHSQSGYVEYAVSFRRAIFLQMEKLSKAIETGDISFYEPIQIR